MLNSKSYNIFIITSQVLNPDNVYLSTFELSLARTLQANGFIVTIISVDNKFNVYTKGNDFVKHLLALDFKNCSKDFIDLIYIFKHVFKQKYYLQKKYKINSIDVFESIPLIINNKRLLNSKSWINACIHSFQFAISLKDKPHIIHAHSRFLLAGLAAQKIMDKFHIPYVITEHSSTILRGKFKNALSNKLKTVYNDSVLVISVSNALSYAINKIGIPPQKIRVLPNFTNPDFEAPVKENILNDKFKILHIADFSSNKNQILLLKALSYLNSDNITVEFIGNGYLLNNIIKIAKGHKFTHNIKFLGHMNHEDIILHLDSCNLLISTSNFETFGCVLLEALARGRPVISTDSGGPKDIITSDVGYIINKDDPHNLAITIKQIMSQNNYFSAQNIRSYYDKKFSSKVLLSELISIYKKIL